MCASEEHRPPIYQTTPYEYLVPGKTYRVIQAFADFDGHAHPEGEEWQFLGWT